MQSEKGIRVPFEVVVDGLKVFGLIHKPRSFSGKLPWVLFFHGFGGSKTGRHRYLVDLSSRLAEAGIASVRFDFRGSGDSEGLFEDQTISTQLEDAWEVFRKIGLDQDLDTDRVALFGRSFGGYFTNLFASELQKAQCAPKSLCIMVPFFGLSGGGSNRTELPFPLGWDSSKKQLTFHGMPISVQLMADLKKNSLEQVLPQLELIPLFHIQAAHDTIVGREHQARYKDLRKTASAETLFLDLPGSDHELSEYSERMKSLDYVVEWFKRTV